jgi:hypothetical protein
MKTEPPFTIPDAPLENQRIEPIEEKQKIRRELPEKNLEKKILDKSDKRAAGKDDTKFPPDPFGRNGTKFDATV